MVKDITFGQYIDSKSPIHRLDPRIKIIILIIELVVLFLCKGFITLGVMLALTLGVMVISKVSFKLYFKIKFISNFNSICKQCPFTT